MATDMAKMEVFPARRPAEGGDGTRQMSCRVTGTANTSLSTTFRSRGTKGWDELQGKAGGGGGAALHIGR